MGGWGLIWCHTQAFEPINCQPPVMRCGTSVKIWPLAFYSGFFGTCVPVFRNESVLCGRETEVWCGVNQLATSGNGRWDYFPDLTLLGIGLFGLVYIFWKTEGCSVVDWGLIWCQTHAFQPICNCQLPEMGRGIPFWEPEYEVLFEAKGTSPWNQKSKIFKTGGKTVS